MKYLMHTVIASLVASSGMFSTQVAGKPASESGVDAISLFDRAKAAYATGRLSEAQTYLKKVSASDNSLKAEALNLLGKIAHKKGDVAEAKSLYEKALAQDPSLNEARFNLGIAFFDSKDYTEAEKLFVKSLAVTPSSSDIQYNLAVTYERLGKKADAICSYEKAV